MNCTYFLVGRLNNTVSFSLCPMITIPLKKQSHWKDYTFNNMRERAVLLAAGVIRTYVKLYCYDVVIIMKNWLYCWRSLIPVVLKFVSEEFSFFKKQKPQNIHTLCIIKLLIDRIIFLVSLKACQALFKWSVVLSTPHSTSILCRAGVMSETTRNNSRTKIAGERNSPLCVTRMSGYK